MTAVHRSSWHVLAVLASMLGAAHSNLAAAHPPAGEIRIADRPGDSFETIQAAIDAAPKDAVIHIGAGRYDERLRITKPIKLIGAGADKTVIGPNAVTRDTLENELYRWAKMFDDARKPSDLPIDPQEFYNRFKALADVLTEPMIAIDGVQGVELRSLRLTCPGTPRVKSGSSNATAIKLTGAGLRMTDCAIVGCVGDGVRGEGGSSLEIEDCLIAGCWSSGVSMSNRQPGRLAIKNSDIRNCYHNNVWTGSKASPCVIEGCRISGSAWFGIRYGDREPVIERNAIFDNARYGILAEGESGVIRQNVFQRNAMGGVACGGQARLEGNLFLANQGSAVHVRSSAIPYIRHNVIIESPLGVALMFEQQNLEVPANLSITENLFWKIESALARRVPAEQGREVKDQVIELSPESGNRIADPQLSIGPHQVVFEANSPVRDFNLTGIENIALQSRWPLTAEEQAMIPADGTREWNKWKMKPR